MEQVRNEQTIYSAAVYCRLSKDDEQAGESVSIETQKMMLTYFCHERGFSIYDIYADDGYSGLNFNRPAFTKLLEDIDSGKVNLVITKDLSRLGRDYIQTGYYTDVYFSRKRVRYIAVNDGIDTNRDDNDIAPFKNILNDMYAKDLSRKVKSAKRQRAYKGYYISAQAPYGYKVDPLNRNSLIVDEEAAEVVKEIFRLALAGHSLSQISRILSQREIITPGVYKAQNGDTRFSRYLEGKDSFFGWCYQTVRAILRDQVYTGDMVNHKVEVIVFPKLFAKYNAKIGNGVVCLIGGRLSVKEDENPKIILDYFETADGVKVNTTKRVGLFLRFSNNSSSEYLKTVNYLKSNARAGDTMLYFYFEDTKKYFNGSKIIVDDKFVSDLKLILGEKNVILQK